MASFQYAPTQSVAKQGLFGPSHPLTISVQGILVPIPVGGADITMGGSALIITQIGAATSFFYFPSAQETINVLGDALIVTSIGGILCVDYTAIGGITMGGQAFAIAPNIFTASGGLVTAGDAPISVTIAGIDTHCYIPSAVDTITIGGDALIVADTAGILCVNYTAIDGLTMAGDALISSTVAGIDCHDYVATGGLVTNGEADVIITILAGLRGGKAKGIPRHRRRFQGQATHHYYTAEAYFENTLQIGGEADVMFTPAKYQFIRSLPKIPAIDTYQDSEFIALWHELHKRKPATTFTYEPEGGITLGGNASEDYFDFQNFIITHDDDLIIADILSTDGNPFITTTFSQNIAKQRRDDDDIIEILELL